MSALKALEEAARDGADFPALCALADKAADELVGHRLFTVMLFHPEDVEVERIYSSNPKAYPPGGRKEKRDTEWGRQVLENGQCFIGENAADIRRAFADHDLIARLGLESVLNLPLKADGVVMGTANLLSGPGFYGDQHVARLAPVVDVLARTLGPYAQAADRSR